MLQNLIKNIRWELAVFFTKYPYMFVFLIVINVASFTSYIITVTQSMLCTMAFFFITVLPTCWAFVCSDDFSFFKIFRFPIKRTYLGFFHGARLINFETLMEFFEQNDINCYIKPNTMEDTLIAFKNKEDFNYAKLVSSQNPEILGINIH